MAFRVGQKVVCVDASHAPGSGRPTPVLEEQPGRTIDGKWRPDFGFRAARFRPVVERNTDISIFTKMLNPSKQTVDAQ